MSVPDNEFSNILAELRDAITAVQAELTATRTEVKTLANNLDVRLDLEFQAIRAVHVELGRFIQYFIQIQELTGRVNGIFPEEEEDPDPTGNLPEDDQDPDIQDPDIQDPDIQDPDITEAEAVALVDKFVRIAALTAGLTKEELQIAYVGPGYFDTVIAEILKVSLDTVKTAWENIIKKLHAEDRTHALKLIEISKAITPEMKKELDELIRRWTETEDDQDPDFTPEDVMAAATGHIRRAVLTAGLTKEELQIACLWSGYFDMVIAEILKVSLDTVKTAWKNIIRKLHAEDRTHAFKLIEISKAITPEMKKELDELIRRWEEEE